MDSRSCNIDVEVYGLLGRFPEEEDQARIRSCRRESLKDVKGILRCIISCPDC